LLHLSIELHYLSPDAREAPFKLVAENLASKSLLGHQQPPIFKPTHPTGRRSPCFDLNGYLAQLMPTKGLSDRTAPPFGLMTELD
jgi:hypothetical protein